MRHRHGAGLVGPPCTQGALRVQDLFRTRQYASGITAVHSGSEPKQPAPYPTQLFHRAAIDITAVHGGSKPKQPTPYVTHLFRHPGRGVTAPGTLCGSERSPKLHTTAVASLILNLDEMEIKE